MRARYVCFFGVSHFVDETKKMASCGVRMQFLWQDLHFLALRALTQSYLNFIIFIITDNQSLKRSINAHQAIQQSTMRSPSQLHRAPHTGGFKGSPRMQQQ
jgi:hypothetical protein